MVKKIAIVLVVLIAGLLAFAATRPDTFHVERSTLVKAPPEKIFAILEDFHNWGEWSPWDKLDPTMTKSYSGAERGQGAVYSWSGNDDVGKGTMEIIESKPNSKLVEKLHFIEPWESVNTVTFTLTPKGQETEVTWAMDGDSPYMMKLMGIFTDMDEMVGKDFVEGLANLKALAEKG
ncbi:MAG: SRPBCC family protein [Deltaproteobacteria bacterium]|nr:SRPBCC family protein [Deltaproteobacteria bacterium]MCB9788974.1 SRPBCC family protein [Deltaproteobacteria bacterium]